MSVFLGSAPLAARSFSFHDLESPCRGILDGEYGNRRRIAFENFGRESEDRIVL